MSFNPIRHEELRIMGFSDVAHNGEDPRARMAKVVGEGVHDVTDGRVVSSAGDYFVEYADGFTEVVKAEQFEAVGVLMPPEPTEVDESPVELAEPVGLLQRDTEGAADVDE